LPTSSIKDGKIAAIIENGQTGEQDRASNIQQPGARIFDASGKIVTPGLTEDAIRKCVSHAKMNPPLDTESDRMAIYEGLADGTIDAIATGHAPHSNEKKALGLASAPICVSPCPDLEKANRIYYYGRKNVAYPGRR